MRPGLFQVRKDERCFRSPGGAGQRFSPGFFKVRSPCRQALSQCRFCRHCRERWKAGEICPHGGRLHQSNNQKGLRSSLPGSGDAKSKRVVSSRASARGFGFRAEVQGPYGGYRLDAASIGDAGRRGICANRSSGHPSGSHGRAVRRSGAGGRGTGRTLLLGSRGKEQHRRGGLPHKRCGPNSSR